MNWKGRNGACLGAAPSVPLNIVERTSLNFTKASHSQWKPYGPLGNPGTLEGGHRLNTENCKKTSPKGLWELPN